jgi:hypothetical protein
MNPSNRRINFYLYVPIVVSPHGIIAFLFASVLFLRASGTDLSLSSLISENPKFKTTICSSWAYFFATVTISTFSVYKIFLNSSPSYQF